MNDLPGDVLQEIAENMIDVENPAEVCAKWAELCRVMKNGPAMCTNPDDGAWKRGRQRFAPSQTPARPGELTSAVAPCVTTFPRADGCAAARDDRAFHWVTCAKRTL